jgi:large subunit ribosomal protein L25
MAAKNDALAVETRTNIGTTAANALRKHGRVPGVLFGHGAPPTPITLDAKALDELLHGGGRNHLLDITIDGATKDTALVREVQRHPITRRVLHADLQRVSATEEISASLPLVPVGVAEGVKNDGGVMDLVLHTVEVTGPANALPEHIEADVTGLSIGDRFTAGELVLPPGIKLELDPATVLITIEAPRAEREEEAAVAPVAGEVPTVAETTGAESAT